MLGVYFGTKEISENILWPAAVRLRPGEQRSSHKSMGKLGCTGTAKFTVARSVSLFDRLRRDRSRFPFSFSSLFPFPLCSKPSPLRSDPFHNFPITPKTKPFLPFSVVLLLSPPSLPPPPFFYIHIRIYIKIHIYFQTGNLGARRHAQGLRGFACYA